ncbi:MAG: hypothetical protein O3B87_00635 [bacterium]|nr:hypothetical protein [bacterium]
MEHHIISSKLLVIVIGCGILILITSVVFNYVSFSPHIIACNEASGITYIIKTSRTYEIVIPSSSAKDTITCMGRGMMFYDRTVDVFYAIKENDTVLSQLKKRYTIEEVELSNNNERTIISNQGITYALYSKEITDPFEFIRTVKNTKYSFIVGPELESIIQELVIKDSREDLASFIPMKLGDVRKFKLVQE